MSDSATLRRSGGIAEVVELAPMGMIALRGDLADPAMAKAVKAAVGLALPGVRALVTGGDRSAGWMSPDELLLLMPYAEVQKTITALDKALKGKHYLAVDVSDSRAVFRLRGASARDVLAKLTPTDLSPEAFTPGMLRRSRAAQVAAAFWISGADEFTLVCFRSVADYVFGLLQMSVAPGGEVGLY
jgi:sarcosine oxidase, subunit gamma